MKLIIYASGWSSRSPSGLLVKVESHRIGAKQRPKVANQSSYRILFPPDHTIDTKQRFHHHRHKNTPRLVSLHSRLPRFAHLRFGFFLRLDGMYWNRVGYRFEFETCVCDSCEPQGGDWALAVDAVDTLHKLARCHMLGDKSGWVDLRLCVLWWNLVTM